MRAVSQTGWVLWHGALSWIRILGGWEEPDDEEWEDDEDDDDDDDDDDDHGSRRTNLPLGHGPRLSTS